MFGTISLNYSESYFFIKYQNNVAFIKSLYSYIFHEMLTKLVILDYQISIELWLF